MSIRPVLAFAAFAALSLSACLPVGPQVQVVPSGTGVRAVAKPAGCVLPIVRSIAPGQPYDELGSLHYTTSLYHQGDPAAAQDALRERACGLGADAVLVTQEFVPGVAGGHGKPPTMAGVAIKYRASAP